jgi:hypothetical protein
MPRRQTRARLAGNARTRVPGVVLPWGAWPAVLSTIVGIFAAPVTLPAQWLHTSIGIGAASVRYAQALEVTMLSLTPTLSLLSSHGALSATGVLASTAAQGVVAAALTSSFDAPLAVDVALLAGGSRSDGAVTRQSRLTGRVQWRGTRAGLWVGAGRGLVADGSTSSTTRLQDLGAWLTLGAIDLTLTRLPTAAGDSVRFTDTELVARWDRSRVTVEGTAGWRSGTARVTGIDDPGRWQSVSGVWRFSDRVALVAAAGSYPLDLLQGFPAGRFTSVSLRFTPARPMEVRAVRAAASVEPTASANGISTLVVRALDDGRHRLRLRAVGATRVELQGSMTAWAPVAFLPEGDGWFAVDLMIPPGTHELVVRRDGGEWVVPPGLAVRFDEFAGRTGILVIETP